MNKEAITEIVRSNKGEGEVAQIFAAFGLTIGLITLVSFCDGILKSNDPGQNPHAIVTYQEMLKQSKSLEGRIAQERNPIKGEIAPGKDFSINGLGDFHLPK